MFYAFEFYEERRSNRLCCLKYFFSKTSQQCMCTPFQNKQSDWKGTCDWLFTFFPWPSINCLTEDVSFTLMGKKFRCSLPFNMHIVSNIWRHFTCHHFSFHLCSEISDGGFQTFQLVSMNLVVICTYTISINHFL